MEPSKKEELRVFLFITIVLFPVLSLIIVSGLGFSIWISQIFFGPPSV